MRISTTTQKGYSHVVDWTQGTVRKRKFFRTERTARDFLARLKPSLASMPRSQQPPTPEEMLAIYHARASKVPILQAVEAWQRTHGAAQGKTFSDLVAARVADIEADNLSDGYRYSVKNFLEKIPAASLALPVHDITPAVLSAIVFAGGVGAVTQAHRRAILSSVFALAVRSGLLQANPAALVKCHRQRAAAPPGILTPDQARRYLAAVQENAPGLLAADAIGLYAGLRLAEISRLDWSHVRIERGHIEVTAQSAKTKSRRLVDIIPCLAEILRPLAKECGPVVPLGAVHSERHARKFLPFKVPANAARHSFVSYHLALFGDVAKTELQAGHDRAVLFAHYRELVTRADAEDYFK